MARVSCWDFIQFFVNIYRYLHMISWATLVPEIFIKILAFYKWLPTFQRKGQRGTISIQEDNVCQMFVTNVCQIFYKWQTLSKHLPNVYHKCLATVSTKEPKIYQMFLAILCHDKTIVHLPVYIIIIISHLFWNYEG